MVATASVAAPTTSAPVPMKLVEPTANGASDNHDASNGTPAPNGTGTPTNTEPLPESQRVSLAILQDITSAQAAHGLKHSDYERYRSYCTRRVQRIRSATKLTNKHPSHSKRYHARAVSSADVAADARSLQIPLILAERDWAAAMALKGRPQKTSAERVKRSVLAHLSKAIVHARALAQLAGEVATEQTLLEAQAYLQAAVATLALEREQWAVALAAFEVANKIYLGMAGVRAGTSAATLYEKKLEEIAQAIRFCKYNLSRSGRSRAADDDETELLSELRLNDAAGQGGVSDALGGKIEAALAEARRRAAQSFGTISWCGVDVSLRAEHIRETVLLVDQECKTFDEAPSDARSADDYDKLFVVLNDALKVVTDELREFRKSADEADARVRELELIAAYVSHAKLSRIIDRNLLLVESLRSKGSKPDDFVRMYDNLIANAQDMLALKGVDEDAQLSAQLAARKTLFAALRCFHLAQCYQAAALPAEAAALFDRVAVHAATIPPASPYAADAARVVRESAGMKCRARAQAYLDDEEQSADPEPPRSLVDHLYDFASFADADSSHGRQVTICHLPPPLEAVPCKPVLFDLAIDGVRIADEEEEEQEQDEEEEAAPEQNEQEDEPAQSNNEKGQQAQSQPDAKTSEQESDSTSRTSSMFAGTRLGRWWSGSGS